MANLVPYTQSPFNKARKDKFLFVMNLPPCLKEISRKSDRSNETIIPDALQFSVYGAVIPEINVPAVQLRYSGQTLHNSSHARDPYPPVTVNFTVDNRYNNYWTIYKWLDLLNNAQYSYYDADNLTNTDINKESNKKLKTNVNTPLAVVGYDYLRFRANFSLFALDEYDKRVMEFIYKEAFPTALGSINFNNRDTTEIETSFTFEFSQLEVSLIEQVDSL